MTTRKKAKLREVVDHTYPNEQKGSYILPVDCYNCGLKFAAKITKGHTFCPWRDCPRCGVSNHFTTGTVEDLEGERGPAGRRTAK